MIEEKREAPNLIGTTAYDFRLIGLDKEEIHLEDLKGKVVLLDFWDTWCAPCIKSMPLVQELSTKYRESGLVVIGILTEGKNEAAAKKVLFRKALQR